MRLSGKPSLTLCRGCLFAKSRHPSNPNLLVPRNIEKDFILQVYDSLVLNPSSRSRIVSFVYGNTFPLEVPAKAPLPSWSGGRKFSVSSMDELIAKRKTLIAYDPSTRPKAVEGKSFWRIMGKHKTTAQYAAAAVAAVGVGVWLMRGNGDEKKQK